MNRRGIAVAMNEEDASEQRRLLEQEEQSARDELRLARARYHETVSESSCGPEPSEKAERIRLAGAEVLRLEQESLCATRRLMDYLRGAIVDDDSRSK